MKDLLRIWWRAFSIVTMTALNVVQVAQHHYPQAFCTGSLLSYIWWGNAQTAARSDNSAAQWAYALGAGMGTITGMFLGQLF